jgi:hypothetical protein
MFNAEMSLEKARFIMNEILVNLKLASHEAEVIEIFH